MPLRLAPTEHFLSQSEGLRSEGYLQLQKQIILLEQNPRHQSLRTHEVKNAIGSDGGKTFESYVNKKYRFTWEYGKEKGEIILRNVDNHDECLRNP